MSSTVIVTCLKLRLEVPAWGIGNGKGRRELEHHTCIIFGEELPLSALSFLSSFCAIDIVASEVLPSAYNFGSVQGMVDNAFQVLFFQFTHRVPVD